MVALLVTQLPERLREGADRRVGDLAGNLADAIRPSLTRVVTNTRQRRVAVALYQLLASGEPVRVDAIATGSGMGGDG